MNATRQLSGRGRHRDRTSTNPLRLGGCTVHSAASLLACYALLVTAAGTMHSVDKQPRLAWREVFDAPSVQLSGPRGTGSAQAAAKFRSSAIWLDPGRVVLTPPDETPIPVPPPPFLLRGLRVEVVDADGTPVPLTEVYLHHIAFYDGVNSADICGGANLQGRDALWATGAESRHTPTFFPDGYGIPVRQNTSWAANIHLIRTDGVNHVKHCIECHCYSEVGGSAGGGSEDCCPDGSLCAGMAHAPRNGAAGTKRAYYVQFVVWYDRIEEQGHVHTHNRHLRYHTLDASACQLEWNVPAVCPWRFKHAGVTPGAGQLPQRGLRGSGRYFPFDFLMQPAHELREACISTMSWRLAWPYEDGEVVYGKAHLHIGGIDVSLYREAEPHGPRQLLCRASAMYGTGWPSNSSELGSGAPWEHQPAGNEEGYVVKVSTCRDTFTLRRGDQLIVEARYHAAPWFEGVMGLLDLAVAAPRDGPAALQPAAVASAQ